MDDEPHVADGPLDQRSRAGPLGLAEREAALAECLRLIGHQQGARTCPRCAGTSLYRHGIVSGLQRYRCRACGRTFNALTNTPLASLRLREKWLPFLRCMRERTTIRKAADAVGVHMNTSFRWRHRFQAERQTGGDAPAPAAASAHGPPAAREETATGDRERDAMR